MNEKRTEEIQLDIFILLRLVTSCGDVYRTLRLNIC